MRAQAAAGIPLLNRVVQVTSGCDAALDWTHEIALEIARDEGLSPRIALLHSEQSPSTLRDRAMQGRIAPLAPYPRSTPRRSWPVTASSR